MSLAVMGAAEMRRTHAVAASQCTNEVSAVTVVPHALRVAKSLCKSRDERERLAFDILVELGAPQTDTLKEVVTVVAAAQKKRRSCLFV